MKSHMLAHPISNTCILSITCSCNHAPARQGGSIWMIAYPGLTSDYQTSPFLTVLTSRGDRAKADSTLRSSQAVPHPSTDRALSRLTSEVRRDPVHSTRYGRQRRLLTWGSLMRFLCIQNQISEQALFSIQSAWFQA